MAVHIDEALEPVSYWREVAELANELLAASPLRDWTVTVRPPDAAPHAPAAGSRWTSRIDYGSRAFDVVGPVHCADDEASPEDAATFVVLDLLGESVAGLDDHLQPWPSEQPVPATHLSLAPFPPSASHYGSGPCAG